MDTYIGTIMPVAFDFAPQGWALCAGQSMSIAHNADLYSLIGSTYGGDGISTFSLPDLRCLATEATSSPGISGGTSQVNAKKSSGQPFSDLSYIIRVEGLFPAEL